MDGLCFMIAAIRTEVFSFWLFVLLGVSEWESFVLQPAVPVPRVFGTA